MGTIVSLPCPQIVELLSCSGLKQGYTPIAAGMDTLLLDQSVRRLLSALKP